jgi:hypothetical protein
LLRVRVPSATHGILDFRVPIFDLQANIDKFCVQSEI